MRILYQFEASPFCDKVRRILHVKRLSYETREIGLLESQTGYRKINPAGKVPALSEDGQVICDSTEIAYYLEERYPNPPLLPKDPGERALVQVLEDWADESLYFYEMRLRFGFAHNRARVLPRLLSSENRVVKGLGTFLAPRAIQMQLSAQGIGRKSDSLILAELGRHIETIKNLLGEKKYLVGSSLSLADIAVYSQLACIRDSAEGEAEISRAPEVASYLERIDKETRPKPKNAPFEA